MSHELDMSKGRAAIAYTGETPWHQYGHRFDKPFTSEEAMQQAGLDYEVELQELFTADQNVDSHKAVVRNDTGTVLGIVGNGYKPLQNKEAFRFFDAAVDEGEALYETAGALKNGSLIWLLAKIKGQIKILAEDYVDKYFLLTNRHDGKGSVTGRVTPVRVVCWNTLTASLNRNVKEEVRLVHRGNVADRLEVAGTLLGQIGAFYDELSEVYRKFARVNIKEKQMKQYIAESLRPYGNSENRNVSEEDKAPARLVTEVNNVMELVEIGKGADIKGVRGTLWGTYNAITEYVDHHKRPKAGEDGRIQYIGFGSGKMVKDAALRLGINFAKTGFVEENQVILN